MLGAKLTKQGILGYFTPSRINIIFREHVNLYSDDEQFLMEVFIGHCLYSWDTPRDYQDVTDNPFMQIYGH